jgi:hypothetical protein
MHRLCCEWYLADVCCVTLQLISSWFQHSPSVQYVGNGEFEYSGIMSAREIDSAMRRYLMRSHKQVPFTDFLKISVSCVKENWCLVNSPDKIYFGLCVFFSDLRVVSPSLAHVNETRLCTKRAC